MALSSLIFTVADLSRNTQYAIQLRGETTILDQTRRTKELNIHEALGHILMAPSDQRLTLNLVTCILIGSTNTVGSIRARAGQD